VLKNLLIKSSDTSYNILKEVVCDNKKQATVSRYSDGKYRERQESWWKECHAVSLEDLVQSCSCNIIFESKIDISAVERPQMLLGFLSM